MPEGFITFMLSDPIILGLISVVIIAPLAEEFLFRGFCIRNFLELYWEVGEQLF